MYIHIYTNISIYVNIFLDISQLKLVMGGSGKPVTSWSAVIFVECISIFSLPDVILQVITKHLNSRGRLEKLLLYLVLNNELHLLNCSQAVQS